MIAALERILFANRAAVLWFMAGITLVTLIAATRLEVGTDFDRTLPADHPFVETFKTYRDESPLAREIGIGVRFEAGTVWSRDGLSVVSEIEAILARLDQIEDGSIVSILSPYAVTADADGRLRTVPRLISEGVDLEALGQEDIALARRQAQALNLVGPMVTPSGDATLIRVLIESPGGAAPDYFRLAEDLERAVRAPYRGQGVEIAIAGFPKRVGDTAAAARQSIPFFFLALTITAVVVFLFCRSISLTALAVLCSLISVVWQFGLLQLFGFVFDPTTLLVPFIIYAIGVSHGVQQINLIAREVCWGESAEGAARKSFRMLFIPGALALVTDAAAFAGLALIPIPILRDIALLAALGILLKVASNLILLPLMASYVRFGERYVEHMSRSGEQRLVFMNRLAGVVRPRNAFLIVGVAALFGALAYFGAQERTIGDFRPGAGELAASSPYNRDARALAERFGFGGEAFAVYVSGAPGMCGTQEARTLVQESGATLTGVPGLRDVATLPALEASGRFEASLALRDAPPPQGPISTPPRQGGVAGVDPVITLAAEPIRASAIVGKQCSWLAALAFSDDRSYTMLSRLSEAGASLRMSEGPQVLGEPIRVEAGGGVLGLQAALTEVIERSEPWALAYVFIAIALIVGLAYRDWKAAICCLAPLGLATLFGLWFMAVFDVAITEATLPVLLLSVGIGVDYAFYFYNRLQVHLGNRYDMIDSFTQAMEEAGLAVVITGLTLAAGVLVWSLSALQFQADMGFLLAVMLVMNTLAAITVLPALAVALDRLVPRRSAMRFTL